MPVSNDLIKQALEKQKKVQEEIAKAADEIRKKKEQEQKTPSGQ